jgi:tRNA dimethylallyltransferase
MKQIHFVLGPTGVGKSDFATELALQMGAVIVNCDSQQVYKDLNIGTAKPSNEQMAAVPHFFYDFIEPGIQYTAGEYRRDVLDFLDERRDISNYVFVGGSGFYAQSLTTEMYSIGKANEDVRAQIMEDFANVGLEGLFHELSLRDPDYANKIGPRDRYRLLRSVEIVRATGKTPSELYQESEKSRNPLLDRGFTIRKIALYMDKEALRERIRKRTQDMLRRGLIEETHALLNRGLGNWRPLNSVGYKEVREWLSGQFPREEILERIVMSTMKLCKRQMTWLKRDPEIEWINAGNFLDRSQTVLSY